MGTVGRWAMVAIGWLLLGNVRAEELDFSTVDVRKLATRTYGTELFLLENDYREGTYKFEDFFWTGSGDGGEDEQNFPSEENPSTVYKTKTVVTTVFLESSHTVNETGKNGSKCSIDCNTVPSVPDGEIKPSPTFSNDSIDGDDFFDADRQFWLLTVLKSDGKDPVVVDIKNSLAKLYKTAFQRQQDKHLGITSSSRESSRGKRDIEDKQVNVYIHRVNKSKLNGDENIEVVYHVSVDGKPVSAIVAAKDMSLVSDDEVRKELGFPFSVKAEPYLKPSEPQSLSSAKNTWLFIGVSIVAFLIFLLILAFILGCTKKKKVGTPTGMGVENRQSVFERGAGHDNKAFSRDTARRDSPTYVKYEGTSTLPRTVGRPASSISSVSTSSGSLDISPLMVVKKHPPKKPPRPRAALNRTVPVEVQRLPPEIFDSDSSRKESPDTACEGNIASPGSYLSMPSVRSFPRGSIPEPLSKVLEPVSVHHLDLPDDEMRNDVNRREIYKRLGLVRHGSLGAGEDPGVLGPVVWSIHKNRMQHGVSVDEGINDINVPTNLTKMRKRFHDLLDDTFSLFGSRRTSPVEDTRPDPRHVQPHVKSRSAIDRSSDNLRAPTPKPRPRTTDLRKVEQPPGNAPRGAWSSTAPSPLVRPLSAGVINPYPRVNVDQVLAEGAFRPNDPAVTLIATIKSEIEKISLPGSTAELNN
ncbi:unnamed protein product [Phyllotreta striolata]|uniref:Uncharacterized protein n=1 Tax=Phyllotreta striolata TaxID=444603 RepID=A0A9N9TXG1_PHYSR|nr:unnamed protein product [Phyllotreta striolata]